MIRAAQTPGGGRGFTRPALELVCVGLIFAAIGSAQVIDRMLAIVDGRVVTASDVDRYREMARLLGDSVPEDPSDLLQEVIENLLIEDEIDQFGSIRIDESLIDGFLAGLGNVGDVSSEAIRDAVRKRLEKVNYFDLRFRRFTGATDEEITVYYETVFRPAALERNLDRVPELDEVRDLIRENVVVEKVNRQIVTWTDSLIRRSDVEVVAYVD